MTNNVILEDSLLTTDDWKNREPLEVRIVHERKSGHRDLKKLNSSKHKTYKIEGLSLIEDAVQN